MTPKYPEITVQLVGQDGNAFLILAKTQKALRKAKVAPEEINLFLEQATAGDYNELLSIVQQWVTVC